MVDRGECTFVQKVRTAQHAGAVAVIVADNVCQCENEECQKAVSSADVSQCEKVEPIMSDDGTGSDVTIPSFMLHKHDADAIKKELFLDTPVRASMSFPVPELGGTVKYELWTQPRDKSSMQLVRTFAAAAKALGKDAVFAPHENFIDGVSLGCEQSGQDVCANLCTNNGKYCSPDPDEALMYGASGADVVTESLRRLCIWDIYGKPNGVGNEWWDYMQHFTEDCENLAMGGFDDTSKFRDPSCIKKVADKAKIDLHKVTKCMSGSGGLEGDVNNTLFEAQHALKTTSKIIVIPTLVINGSPVRGSISFTSAFKAVCAGFSPDKTPPICTECRYCDGDMEQCVKTQSCSSRAAGGVSIAVFTIALSALTIVFVVAAFALHQRQQYLVRQQVRGMLAKYMPLDANAGRDNALGIPEQSELELTVT